MHASPTLHETTGILIRGLKADNLRVHRIDLGLNGVTGRPLLWAPASTHAPPLSSKTHHRVLATIERLMIIEVVKSTAESAETM